MINLYHLYLFKSQGIKNYIANLGLMAYFLRVFL